jgi:hypothetical protein
MTADSTDTTNYSYYSEMNQKSSLVMFSGTWIVRLVSSASKTVAACLLPIVAISVLAKVHGINLIIGLIAAFTGTFAAGLVILSPLSSRLEIFAATAGYVLFHSIYSISYDHRTKANSMPDFRLLWSFLRRPRLDRIRIGCRDFWIILGDLGVVFGHRIYAVDDGNWSSRPYEQHFQVTCSVLPPHLLLDAHLNVKSTSKRVLISVLTKPGRQALINTSPPLFADSTAAAFVAAAPLMVSLVFFSILLSKGIKNRTRMRHATFESNPIYGYGEN